MRRSETLDVLCATPGWGLLRVAEWLLSDGRGFDDPARLLDALCRRLLDAGAPLLRMRFAYRIIHPQIASCAFT
jgi:adenylate cyclase